MWTISSATGTYNVAFAMWLDDKLKPDDTPLLNDILVFHSVLSLFMNVLVEETEEILAEKAFFNKKGQIWTNSWR